MFFKLLIALHLNPFRLCEGSPTFSEEYYRNYVPDVVESWHGLQIVAPNTSYVAAVGRDKLYYIDTRFDEEIASHIKEQIERAFVPRPDEYISINEISATAEVKNAKTGQTTFVFDPPYARVMFAEGINKHNPQMKLPQHEPAGHWLKTYDIGSVLTLSKREPCSSFRDCEDNSDCMRWSMNLCSVCTSYRLADDCALGTVNAIGVCHPSCWRKVDKPREDGETDATYFQRMDQLHWG